VPVDCESEFDVTFNDLLANYLNIGCPEYRGCRCRKGGGCPSVCKVGDLIQVGLGINF